MLTAVFLQTHLLGSADAVQMLHRTIISIGSLPINRSIYLQEVRPQKQSTGSGKSKPEIFFSRVKEVGGEGVVSTMLLYFTTPSVPQRKSF